MATEQKRLQELLQNLESNHNTILDVSGMGLSDDEMLQVSEFISSHDDIEVINIAGNPVTLDTMKKLLAAIKSHKNVKILDMSQSALEDEQAVIVADTIKHHFSLIKVDVSDNEISESIKDFAEVIKENNRLLALNLSFNDIGLTGGKELRDAMKENKTLISLEICEQYADLGGKYTEVRLQPQDEAAIRRQFLKNCKDFQKEMSKKIEAYPISDALLAYEKSKILFSFSKKTLHDDPIICIGGFQHKSIVTKFSS